MKKNTVDYKELATLIEINSYTGNKAGVDASGQLVAQWMEALGYLTQRHSRETLGDHLHFCAPKVSGKKILLLGHLDTVFPQGEFEGFREDGQWIYGPGVCDMKGGIYVALCALRTIHRERGGIHNIDMLLVSDEETGSDDSKLVTTKLAGQYDACLVFEAAGKNNEVVTARKGVGTIYLELTGKAAHAGNNYHLGCNANLAAAHLLIALTALTDLEQGTTVNVGQINGGIGANTISPSARLAVEFRFTCASERDRLMSSIDQIISQSVVEGVTIAMTGGLQRDVMTASEPQQSLLDEIEIILGYPLPTEQRGGVSDANTISAAGVPTLDGFGPFGDGDHTHHERASKASFTQRIEQVTGILRHFQ